MTARFPDTREFTGALYKPSRFEGEVFHLEVDGQLPTDIDGTFFLVAPDAAFPPMREDDIFFTLPYAEDRVGRRPFQFFNQLAHLDLGTGKIQTWFADDASCFQEPVFAPRTRSSREGDGYLLSLNNRLDERTTDMVVLDTLRLGEGPIATVKLPLRMRMALHGNWSPAASPSSVKAA